MQDLTMPEQIV